MASPYWSAKREKMIANRLEGALCGESDDVDEPDPLASFTSQWLNKWPSKRLKNVKGEELISVEAWDALAGEVADDPERVWIAIEDHSGMGAAIAAVCRQPDGKLGVDGWLTSTWPDAMADLRRLINTHDVAKLQVGASLMMRLPPGMRATPMTSTATRSTLPLMRELVAAGLLVHESEDLDDQVETGAGGGGDRRSGDGRRYSPAPTRCVQRLGRWPPHTSPSARPRSTNSEIPQSPIVLLS